jgi:uncharacterized protein (TIGR02722 family)
MIKVDSIKNGSALLVSTMKNDTNGDLQSGKVTEILTRLITNVGKDLRVVEANELIKARQRLGISENDNLHSCRKAVGIARYLNVEYLLYNTAAGNVKKPLLDLQLMLVKTGEIIWSGKRVATIKEY